MHILIAPDSFKDALSAHEAAIAIETGLLAINPLLKTTCVPMADGGEGSLDAIFAATSSYTKQYVNAVDPLGRLLNSFYLYDAAQNTAIVELAKTAGLQLLQPRERNVLNTSTAGVGITVKKAIAIGAKTLLLCIGGSATNDCGAGMVQQLGFVFYDEEEKEITKICGGTLHKVKRIAAPANNTYAHIAFNVLCDVTNPLTGPAGAVYIYAEQKGIARDDLPFLEKSTQRFGNLLSAYCGKDVNQITGGGAAGGTAAGMAALFNAKRVEGFTAIARLTHLEQHIKKSDIVITGEGKIDATSVAGKVLSGIATLCHTYKKPLYVFCGTAYNPADIIKTLPAIEQILPIADKTLPLQKNLKKTKKRLMQHARQLAQHWLSNK